MQVTAASKILLQSNCSAFSKGVIGNELFGHKAGAFTGAIKDSKGIFEEASNGTVFLDEIGEMPLDLQAKLLRVLESGEFLKVGDNKPTKVNVRIIAATTEIWRKRSKPETSGKIFITGSIFLIFHYPLLEKEFLI